MSSFKLSVLSCYIALLSLPASAVDCSMPFIKDAVVNGRVQTQYFNEENTSVNKTRGAWTAAVWLNGETGFITDFISVGGSAYRSAKVEMKSGNGTNSADLLAADGEPIGKLGQAWVHIKLAQACDGVNAGIKAGRQLVETGLLSTSTGRSVPGSWQGVDASLDVAGFNGEFGWFNQVSERTQSGFHPVINSENKKIDWVIGAQLNYSFELEGKRSLELQYNNGMAKDFIFSHNGNVIFSTPMHNDATLTLGGMYYYAKEHGDLWNASGFKNDAQSGNLYTVLESGPWTFNAGITYTRAKLPDDAQDLGFYYDQFGENTRGTFDAPTAAIFSSFNFDDETAWVLGAQYDFSRFGLEGLSLGYSFFHGSGMKAKSTNGTEHKVRESENDLTLIYNFPQPELKGLELKATYVYYTNSEAMVGPSGQGEQKNLRAYLIYHFSI